MIIILDRFIGACQCGGQAIDHVRIMSIPLTSLPIPFPFLLILIVLVKQSVEKD